MNRERVPAVPQSAQNAAFLAVATAIALAMRLFLFPLESGDYQQFLHPWFETLRQNGGLAAIGLEIGRLHAALFLCAGPAHLSAGPGSVLDQGRFLCGGCGARRVCGKPGLRRSPSLADLDGSLLCGAVPALGVSQFGSLGPVRCHVRVGAACLRLLRVEGAGCGRRRLVRRVNHAQAAGRFPRAAFSPASAEKAAALAQRAGCAGRVCGGLSACRRHGPESVGSAHHLFPPSRAV